MFAARAQGSSAGEQGDCMCMQQHLHHRDAKIFHGRSSAAIDKEAMAKASQKLGLKAMPSLALSKDAVSIFCILHTAAQEQQRKDLDEALAIAQSNVMGHAVANHNKIMEALQSHGEILARLDNSRELRQEAARRKQDEQCGSACEALPYNTPSLPDEALQLLAEDKEKLLFAELCEAVVKKKQHETMASKIRGQAFTEDTSTRECLALKQHAREATGVSLLRRRVQDLQRFCIENGLASTGSKKQMIERIVAARLCPPRPKSEAGKTNLLISNAPPDEPDASVLNVHGKHKPAKRLRSSPRTIRYYGGRDGAGKYHGLGCLETPGCCKYIGEFQHGVKRGRGVLVNASGTYIGEFVGDLPHGLGVLVDKDSNRYEAQFEVGRPCKGVVTRADGTVIKGHLFHNGYLHGHGSIDYFHGYREMGEYICGGHVRGQQHTLDGVVVKGTFDTKSEIHGYGQCTLVTGDLVQGRFEHGVPSIYQALRVNQHVRDASTWKVAVGECERVITSSGIPSDTTAAARSTRHKYS
eukprot:6009945-Karenia_brevis.AAC.1